MKKVSLCIVLLQEKTRFGVNNSTSFDKLLDVSFYLGQNIELYIIYMLENLKDFKTTFIFVPELMTFYARHIISV